MHVAKVVWACAKDVSVLQEPHNASVLSLMTEYSSPCMPAYFTWSLLTAGAAAIHKGTSRQPEPTLSVQDTHAQVSTCCNHPSLVPDFRSHHLARLRYLFQTI